LLRRIQVGVEARRYINEDQENDIEELDSISWLKGRQYARKKDKGSTYEAHTHNPILVMQLPEDDNSIRTSECIRPS